MKIGCVRILLASALALGALAAPASASSLMAVQSDGKIVVGGKAAPDNGFVARLTPDGNLDPTFGRDGMVIDRRIPPLKTLAVDADGRIVVTFDGGLARYEADGQSDWSFGDGGTVREGDTFSIVPMANGLIAVARQHGAPKLSVPSVGIDLLAPSGQLAWPFVRLGPPPTIVGSEMLQLADGAFLLAGGGFTGSPSIHPLLVRFVLGSGRPDSSFGDDNYALGPSDVTFEAVAEQDRKLYTAGRGANGLAVMRFTDSGDPDPGFGSEGLVEAGSSDSGELTGADVAVQADGKAVVAAEGRLCSGCPRTWLARLDSDGELDESFGDDGFVFAKDATGAPLISRGKDVVLLPGGRSLVLGTGPTQGVVLAAFDSDGEPAPSFGNAGVRTIVPTCAGDVATQRASGCLPSARARLRVRHLRRKSSILNLHVRPKQPWSRIVSVRFLLPRALRIRQRMAGRIMARLHFANSAGKADLKTGRQGMKIFADDARSIHVRIPRTVLRRVKAVRGGRRLPFRVWVEFGHGLGTQRLVLRRAG